MTLSDSERAAIGEAAGRVGMAAAAWLGQTGVDAARYRTRPVPAMHRELLTELAQTRARLSLASAQLDGVGPEAAAAATACRQAAQRLQAAADRIISGLPR